MSFCPFPLTIVLSVLLRFTVSDYLFVRYLQALPTTNNQIHWLLQPEYFMNTMALTTRCHCMSYRTAYFLFLRLYYSHYLFQQRSNNNFFSFFLPTSCSSHYLKHLKRKVIRRTYLQEVIHKFCNSFIKHLIWSVLELHKGNSCHFSLCVGQILCQSNSIPFTSVHSRHFRHIFLLLSLSSEACRNLVEYTTIQ